VPDLGGQPPGRDGPDDDERADALGGAPLGLGRRQHQGGRWRLAPAPARPQHGEVERGRVAVDDQDLGGLGPARLADLERAHQPHRVAGRLERDAQLGSEGRVVDADEDGEHAPR
jgi:hypothetical protein